MLFFRIYRLTINEKNSSFFYHYRFCNKYRNRFPLQAALIVNGYRPTRSPVCTTDRINYSNYAVARIDRRPARFAALEV